MAPASGQSTGNAPDIQQAINLALQHHNAGRLPEAERLYQQILQADPNQPVALHMLGMIAHQVGNSDHAVDLITKALTIKPDYVKAHSNLGNALKELGRLEEAVASYRKALALKPDLAETHFNLGSTLGEMNRLDEAIDSFHKAIVFKPDLVEAHNNLGNALKILGKLDEATTSYQKALVVNPDYAMAHNNLGNMLQEQGKPDEALASYRKALVLKPDYDEAHSNLIFIQDLISNFDHVDQQAERKLWNDKFILSLSDKIKPHANDPTPERRLRIGYVSADFRQHSACQGFAPLILEHDRDHFDVVCYDATIAADDMTETLRDAATSWRSTLGQSDDQLAQTIRDDGIDILVDLSGHTRGNRLTVFGHKPAPLQVTGIGSTPPGVSTIDYRLTTDRTTSPEEESLFPEAPIYLETIIGFTPPLDTPPVGPPPCLESGVITFGYLGRFSKISDDAMALWARILRDVPKSRLLIKAAQMDEPSIRQRVETFFSERGISQDRLILLGGTPQRQHLETCNRIDIALDAFPHGGGITTMESLWMGVPVVGLTDPSDHASRSISIICGPLGLDEWIAASTGEYHAIAVEWADKRQALADLRPGLRQRVSEVYSRFPRDAEKAYRLIWKRWCGGEAPSPLYPLS